MRVLDFLKHKIKLASILVTREELRSVLNLTVLEPPKGARYQIGDTICTSGIGSALGNFKVYGIKAGGYGFAYIVLDEETLTPYCLKTSREKSPKGVEQFKREAETWVRIGKHPNLVYAHCVLSISGRPHIVFEYAAGADLWRQIKKGRIPVKTTLGYAIQFCRGMRYAQSKFPGFVHGDIKPNNCLVAQDQTLKIADFGQADFGVESLAFPGIPSSDKGFISNSEVVETPRSNWRAGTPPYMAPEQFDLANKTDVRSDVYSFGVMLFEMLTGTRPFVGKRHKECYVQHRTAIPPDPLSLNAEIPPALALLILRCLAKSPAERPQDFGVMEDELSSLLWTLHQEQVPLVEPDQLTDVELANRAISLVALDYHEEALGHFDKLLAVNPQFARVWSHKGDVLSGLGRYDESLVCFDQALKLDPRLAYARGSKGKTLDQLGRYEGALACFDHALNLDARLAFVWNDKGQTLIHLGQPVESLKSLRRALALDPKHFKTQYNLGITLDMLGRHDEAMQAYKQAISLNRQYAKAHYRLGKAYHRAGRLREAIEFYRQANSVKPDYEKARNGLGNAYYEFCSASKQFVSESYAETVIAFLLTEQNDSDVVVSTTTDFLRLSNFDPRLFYVCASKIYYALEKISQSQKESLTDILAQVRKSITIEPDQSNFYWLGKIYYGLAQYDECLEVFQQSITLFGPDDKALYFIAACYEIRNEHQTALEYYRQALVQDPNCLLTSSGVKRMEAWLASARAVSSLVTQ